jgi:two-component system, NtrC family, response regulator HydG
MNPRLVSVSGALTGEVLPLKNDDPVSLGREAANRIPISDVSVSRRHCVITAEGGQYVIRDLNSRNGTFVNELPIRERVLEDGDQIRVGESVFLFLAPSTEAGTMLPAESAEEALLTQTVVRLSRREIEHNMIGESPAMREVYLFIAKVAPKETTVLIRGESGTGKELVARAIHRNSPRVNGPFVAINCAALTETLLESELFGHEKGAFTGATAQKRGKLEVADGGTLFLDEVGELPPGIQVKLLRVLQEREFERVGGTRPVRVDIRLITATNRDLDAAIKTGGFRPDLYFRLNVVSITMPALRERREDIPLLAGHFAARSSEKAKRRVLGLSADARALLLRYDWPGNIRELENAIERAVVLGSSDHILPEDLPEALLEAGQPGEAGASGYHAAVLDAKRRLILEAVEQAGGNLTEAARILELHPNYLHRLVTNMNLRTELKRGTGRGAP